MNIKSEMKALTEAYTKIYEMEVGEEPEDHKHRMVNSAAELASIAFRIKKGEVRPEDGDRLMDIAKKIEMEYEDQ